MGRVRPWVAECGRDGTVFEPFNFQRATLTLHRRPRGAKLSAVYRVDLGSWIDTVLPPKIMVGASIWSLQTAGMHDQRPELIRVPDRVEVRVLFHEAQVAEARA